MSAKARELAHWRQNTKIESISNRNMFSFKLSFICILHIISLLTFLYGYFPLQSKFIEPGGASCLERSSEFYGELKRGTNGCPRLTAWLESREKKNPPLVDNVVLIIIDALRYDFIFENADGPNGNMDFVRNQIKAGTVHSHRATVQPPTVTMPRIKAVTGGIVPTFADVVLNLASPAFVEDNVISTAKQCGYRLVFYGDDTWLKLFPNHFDHSDGVTSFVVTDYTEVDDNVTRNLNSALNRSDQWDLMVLHYIGLDHIGHLAGPNSPLIPIKLAEMDGIIEKIYNNLKKADRTFCMIVLGDHGMTDVGSHGGASQSETTVPLLFITSNSPSQSGSTGSGMVQQVDLTPTLAGLLGLPIPINSVGVLLASVIDSFVLDNAWDRTDRIRQNAEQLMRLLTRNSGNQASMTSLAKYDAINKDFYNWIMDEFCQQNRSGDIVTTDLDILHNQYRNLCEEIRTNLITSSIDYNQTALYFGIIGAWLALLLSSLYAGNNFISTGVNNRCWFLLIGLVIHTFSFGSSSFIEEEHQTWYFLLSSYLALCLLNCRRPVDAIQCSVVMLVFRVLRSWNRAGINWRHLKCLTDWIIQPSNWMYKVTLIYGVGAVGCCVLSCYDSRGWKGKSAAFLGFTLMMLYRLNVLPITWNLMAVRCVYTLCVLLFLLHCPLAGALLLTSLLVKTTNLPVLLGTVLMHRLVTRRTDATPVEIICFSYYLAMFSYFALGNSNSIGHVDVSSGFVGVDSYSPFLNGLLIIVHLYAGPLLVLVSTRANLRYNFKSLYMVLTLKSLPTAFYLLIAYFQRYHLFVWSVFAPKLLYECMHMALVCLTVFVSQFFIVHN